MSEKETILKVNPEQPSKVKLKGLTKTQVKLLKLGKLPLVALAGILGGAVYGKSKNPLNHKFATDNIDFDSNSDIRSQTNDEADIEEVDIEEGKSELFDLEVNTNVQLADSPNDSMNFGDAFEAARNQMGGGGFFMWRGQPYSTYTKEEWDSFSSDQKKEFFEAFKESSDFENAKEEPSDIDTETDPEIETEDASENDSEENGEENEPAGETETEVEPEAKTETEEVEPDLEPEAESEEITTEDFVELDELGTEDEIIDGLNDGEAFDEEDNFGEDLEL